ncbi:MoxR family ATPase [Aneurinibacillus sp. BA2021]|nr:MoxR family ATPase [Aneurinibacillus sp. BA2021]
MSETRMASIEQAFREEGYITDRATATALHLVMALKKPLLVEGPAGVGKTEIAKVLARVLNTRLIRLQCYEGLDAQAALYEWNYQKQLLHLKITEHAGMSPAEREAQIFGPDFLLRRPLLEAISQPDASPVLLIDEIDRADEEFEAFLLELLAEFQITVPELGTLRAQHRPYVILTSNRTRELSEALRRRCLYHWISYPDRDKEQAILQAHLPDIDQKLAQQIVSMMEKIRRLPLDKMPGVAETLDWAQALVLLHQGALHPQAVKETLGCLAKDPEDWARIEEAFAAEKGAQDDT